MSSILNRTFDLVQQGQLDKVQSIPTGIPKFDEFAYGIRQGTYYLIGGDTGTGKSSFVRSVFMHNAYEYFLKVNNPDKLDVLFIDFSLEISAEMNIGSLITRKAWYEYDKVWPASKIFNWTNDKLKPDDLKIIESFKPYLNEFQKKCVTIDGEVSPTMFHDVLMEVAKRHGKFTTEGRYISECGEYIPDNPNMFFIILFDTLNLAELDSGHTTIKSSMDRISKIAVRFRNKCNFTFVPVGQFNSDIATTDRARFGNNGPVLKDFMDSTGPTKDCTVAMGLYLPMRYMRDDQTMWRGYDVSQLRSWLVSLHIMKNRYGQANKYIPCKFDGALGTFQQLPETKDMDENAYLIATRH